MLTARSSDAHTVLLAQRSCGSTNCCGIKGCMQVAMCGELTGKKRTAGLAARLASRVAWVLGPCLSLLMHDAGAWLVLMTGVLEQAALATLKSVSTQLSSFTYTCSNELPGLHQFVLSLQVVSWCRVWQLSASALLQAPLPSPACAGAGGWHPRCSFRALACSPGCAPSSLTRWVNSSCIDKLQAPLGIAAVAT